MIEQNASTMKYKIKNEQKSKNKATGFQFKQFTIAQDACAMKVGTDGVLLGAWVNLNNAEKILDIGTGTGLLTLMCAQRLQTQQHSFQIVAVEKDENAFLQAQENIEQSPWAQKIKIYHQDVQDFVGQKGNDKFDCILSNPPYFPACIPCKNKERDLARYTEQSHFQWLEWAKSCLTEKGKIHFVLPFEAGLYLLQQTSLYCIRRCDVITKEGKQPSRILLTFSSQEQPCEREELTVYNENNQYTPEFIALTKDFYLKM